MLSIKGNLGASVFLLFAHAALGDVDSDSIPTLIKIDGIRTGYEASLGDYSVQLTEIHSVIPPREKTIRASVEQRVSGQNVWTHRIATVVLGQSSEPPEIEEVYLVSTPQRFMMYHVGNPFAYSWSTPTSGEMPDTAKFALEGWGKAYLNRVAFGDRYSSPTVLKDLLQEDPSFSCTVSSSIDPNSPQGSSPTPPSGDILFALRGSDNTRMEIQFDSRNGYLLNSARFYHSLSQMTKSISVEPKVVEPGKIIPWKWVVDEYSAGGAAPDQIESHKEYTLTSFAESAQDQGTFEPSSLHMPDGTRMIHTNETGGLELFVLLNGQLNRDVEMEASLLPQPPTN